MDFYYACRSLMQDFIQPPVTHAIYFPVLPRRRHAAKLRGATRDANLTPCKVLTLTSPYTNYMPCHPILITCTSQDKKKTKQQSTGFQEDSTLTATEVMCLASSPKDATIYSIYRCCPEVHLLSPAQYNSLLLCLDPNMPQFTLFRCSVLQVT